MTAVSVRYVSTGIIRPPSLAAACATLLMAAVACSSSPAPAPASPTAEAVPTGTEAVPTPVAQTIPGTSVLLFDVAPEPSVHTLSNLAGSAFLEWLDDGTRIVAYNWAGHAYEIWGIDGTTADRRYDVFAPQPAGNRRTEWAEVIPGGASILLQNDSAGPRLYDVAGRAFHEVSPPPGQNVSFTGSPDGSKLIFNNIADGRSTVMTSDLDGANARVLVAEPDGSIGTLDDQPISPDGKDLLLGSTVDANGQHHPSDLVADMDGRIIWRLPVPDVEGGVATDIRWAGSDRVLVAQTRVERASGLATVTSKFISIPSGAETPAPDALAQRLVSLSPDGQHAIMLLGDGKSRWDQRCALVTIDPTDGSIEELASAMAAPADYQTVFCASVSWTADGSQAIVSAGGI